MNPSGVESGDGRAAARSMAGAVAIQKRSSCKTFGTEPKYTQHMFLGIGDLSSSSPTKQLVQQHTLFRHEGGVNSEVGPSTYDPSRVIQRKRFGGTFDLPTADEIDALPLDRRMKLGLPPEMWRVEAKKEEDDDDDRFIYQSTPSEGSQRRWKMGGRAPRWQYFYADGPAADTSRHPDDVR